MDVAFLVAAFVLLLALSMLLGGRWRITYTDDRGRTYRFSLRGPFSKPFPDDEVVKKSEEP